MQNFIKTTKYMLFLFLYTNYNFYVKTSASKKEIATFQTKNGGRFQYRQC